MILLISAFQVAGITDATFATFYKSIWTLFSSKRVFKQERGPSG
jgi:hypothetical protein